MPDRGCRTRIAYLLHTGIQREYLPNNLGFGSGMTRRRRLRDRNEAGVRHRLHEILLAQLNATSVGTSPVRAPKTAHQSRSC